MNATSTILAVLSLSGAAFSQTVLHVDDDASPGGNGLSWVTAYSDLQVALAVARQPGSVVTQIWVAEGTYVPSQIGDRSVSFELHNGLALYGGFAGGETALAMRDPDAHVSLLSGDLLGDDVQPFMNNTDNSAHVVRGRIGVNSSALLDGFSIEGGAALNDDGGGIHLSDAGPTIRNCRIRWNLATDNGAGIYNEWNSPVVEDCLFESNRSFNSGGAWANFGLPGFLGGDPRCVRNRFVRNTAGSLGGAVRCHMGDMSFEACSFEENGSTNGADIVFNTSTSSVVDCTFDRSDGVAILTQFTDLILESCVVREANESGVKFGVGSVVLRECVFEDNFNQLRGGAAVVEATDVEFLRCTFRDNRSPVNGGALYLGVPSAPRIRDCTFIGNTSTASDAGAIDSESVGDPRIHNCVFIGNSASQDGGAVKMGTGEIVNSLFVGNSGGLGGALHVGGTTRVVNCTVVRNNGLSVSGTGGIYLTGSSTAVLNTILWDNRIGTNTAEIAQIRVSSGGAPAVFSDCSVMGYVGTIPGTNVGEFSPMFVDPLGPDGTPGTADDDLRLSAGSSLIDRGDTAHLVADSLDLDGDSDTLELVPFDLLGEPRAVDVPSVADSGPPPVPNVDLGAFEFSD
ncbi:MAG: right-handed parallel beta-helix repeat-containing protein, partial [Planctomycetes bacterium]|nr:right-handed parallel beta-helix repeat-containing protein [Planctomycetota bacterium]